MTTGTVCIQIEVLLTSLGLQSIHIVNTRFLYHVQCVQNENVATGFEKWIVIFANSRLYWHHILHEYMLHSCAMRDRLIFQSQWHMPYLNIYLFRVAEHSVRPPSSFTAALCYHDLFSWPWSVPPGILLTCGVQVRQSHHITEVNWYPSYTVVIVISEKPVYKLRQWLGIRREVVRGDRSYKPLQDIEP